MAGLCEGSNEPAGSLKAITLFSFLYKTTRSEIQDQIRDVVVSCQGESEVYCYGCQQPIKGRFKVCHGSLYAIMWLADEPREFNLPTLPQRCITYEAEKLPSKYGVHSEEYVPIRTVTPVVAGM
ncbi:hypothetical protein ANN_07702 [Periplaneta americana]|uniref:Uncharacterized protein n=1 Tax=Periplaneta americana TaxID=6978 RepID=A0ABQ8T1K7_PERAM|nr:hypothetical protein ANN_07702 [Periplaneta americana]